MSAPVVLEQVCKTGRHTTHYLRAGPADGPLIVFVHGWPELAISWRRQLRCFADLGFLVVAPDMRGYGRSTVHPRHEDYTMEQVSTDMIELLAHLGRERAIWVGHDWGSPVVWTLASQHADKCLGVASLCVPYHPDGFAPDNVIPLVNRQIYPEDQFPAGQWDYQLFYLENFERATQVLQADPYRTVKALMRAGHPDTRSKPSPLATLRRLGGWFGGGEAAPDLPRDASVLSEDDLSCYVSALTANGFFGPDSWYMNPQRNTEYARSAPHRERLPMPVLFLHASNDPVCESLVSRLAEPMRVCCPDLTEGVVESGHWMQQQQPEAVNGHLARWLATRLPQHWPTTPR